MRDAVFEPAYQIQEMPAAVARVGGIERERQPQLDLLVVNVEPGRHDPDDARRDAVDRNHPADDGFVAGERRLPDF